MKVQRVSRGIAVLDYLETLKMGERSSPEKLVPHDRRKAF
jgi:hypothetical protein